MVSNQKKKYCINRRIVLNNYKIEMANAISFLGLILDEHLMWKSHISMVKYEKAILFPAQDLYRLYRLVVHALSRNSLH